MYIHLLSVGFLGMALLWSLKLVNGRRDVARDDPMVLMMTVSAWVLIYVGLGLVFGPIMFVIALIIGGMVVARYRHSERRSLLWLLAIAAERGIPLAEAARSYAYGRHNEMGYRALNLAENLEQGVPLPMALERSRNPLPHDGDLAARLGYATDSLATTLREAAQDDDQYSSASQAASGNLMYFAVGIVAMLVVGTFVCVRLVPTYRQILLDFDVELPVVTQLFLRVAGVLANFAWLLAPIMILAVFLLIYSIVGYLGFRVPDLPIVGRLLGRFDTSVILRSLGSGVAQGRPIDQSIELLARWYPVNHVGARLALAARKIKSGGDWCDCLAKERLIRPSDAAVLKAAQRVGNLAWACRELASAHARRAAYRATAMVRIAVPLLALGIGIPIAFFAIAMILPLAQLIEALTG